MVCALKDIKAERFQGIKEAAGKLRERGLQVEMKNLKTVSYIKVKIPRSLNVPRRGLNWEAKVLKNKISHIAKHIEKRTVLMDKKIKNTRKEIQKAEEELQRVLQNIDKILSEFEEFYNEQKREADELLKMFHATNSRAAKEQRQKAKKEREAIAKGQFEEASDKRIKEWLRKEFDLEGISIVILDKSNRHRAITFAKVWAGREVVASCIAGTDDGGQMWCQQVDICSDGDWDPSLPLLSEYSLTVEEAMSKLFCISKELINTAYARQRDILILKAEHVAIEGDVLKGIKEHCGLGLFRVAKERLIQAGSKIFYWYSSRRHLFETKWTVSDPTTFDQEYEILNSHVIEGKGKIQEITVKLADDDFSFSLAVQRLIVANLPEGGRLKHPEHGEISLEPGEYIFVTRPEIFVTPPEILILQILES